MVHRLQAYQKFGERIYTDGLEVRHLDNTRTHNADGNIDLGTKSQNAMDKPVETRVRVAGQAALKHDHAEVLRVYGETKSYTKTMAALGITSKGTISFIVRRSMHSAAGRSLIQPDLIAA